jgi:hypothetical protein
VHTLLIKDFQYSGVQLLGLDHGLDRSVLALTVDCEGKIEDDNSTVDLSIDFTLISIFWDSNSFGEEV